MAFGEKLQLMRKLAGISQQSLSVYTKIPKRTIESWEAGERVPPEYVQYLLLKDLKRKLSEKSKNSLTYRALCGKIKKRNNGCHIRQVVKDLNMTERCTSEKKAMRPLWVLSITTEVNGKTEHTRLLFNDNLKAEERKKNIEKINKEKNVLCSCTLDFYDSYPVLDRLLMLFDGWAAQFEEIPNLSPDIAVSEDGELFLDNQLLFRCDAEIEGAEITPDDIVLHLFPEGDRVIAFEWKDGFDPTVGEIYTIE